MIQYFILIMLVLFLMVFVAFASVLLMQVSRIRRSLEQKRPTTETKKVAKKK